jgi:YVTN family beta-propeller protein
MTNRRDFILVSATAFGCGRRKATGYPGYAFVANTGEHTVAAVDLTTFSVVRQIGLESAPSGVIGHAERRSVYVLIPQNAAIFEIDAADLVVKRKISLKGTAVSMRLASGGSSLWVLCRSPHALVRVSLDRFQVSLRIKLPAEPADFDLSNDGLAAAAVSTDAPSLAYMDLTKAAVARIVPAGDDPRAVRFRLDGRQMLVANRSLRRITIVESKSGATLVHLPLPVEPANFCTKSDGGEIYVTGRGMDAVVGVYPYRTEVAETLLAGRGPGVMAISPSPEYLFVANPESGDVTVLDVYTGTMLAAVKVGQEPCCITFTPDNQYALVVNHRSGDLAVIRVAAIKAGRNKAAPLFTMIPVGTAPVSAVVV